MDGGSHSVLVVDDDPALREAVCVLLEENGSSVTGAQDGQDALDLLRGGCRPCLILLDVAMPFVDGMNFRRQQLECPELARIPVVVVTGNRRQEKEAARLGISMYLRKPVAPDRLVEVVERHCAHAAPSRLTSTG